MNDIQGYGANRNGHVLVLGGGLSGLSAGYALTHAGYRVTVFESDQVVGGLSKTIKKGDFRFDLGGHRFFTTNQKIEKLVRALMRDELISVSRKSKIILRNKYFDYPLRPCNALFGLGIPTTIRILSDYTSERVRRMATERPVVSLEDWVVQHFGRTMFSIYFKEYSEKVWGIGCDRISAEWVSQRIRGLSLAQAIKNAFFRFNGRDLPTLADHFFYPTLGIGRISDRFSEEIEKKNTVCTHTQVRQIHHEDFAVQNVVVENHRGSRVVCGKEFISSIPITRLIRMMKPSPPDEVIDAASRLAFRDLIIVTLMVNRRRVTDQTWIYVPEKKIPFGRIHEPTNWSESMAPEGKTLLVMEYFCFRGDTVWNESDEALVKTTIENLEKLALVSRHDISDSLVVRVPGAYPLFEVGYERHSDQVFRYVEKFTNLHLTGRPGMFRYYNMDHAIESGIQAAERVMQGPADRMNHTRSQDRQTADAIDETPIRAHCT